MNDGIEISGDVLVQAVVAHEIGKGLSGGEANPAHASTCANCGAALTGRYCQNCGQSAHVHRSLLHLIEELLHGIFHFETKAWRTLPMLLFRPGRLTREYIDGRRARYVAPLALFLFTMFLMFMVFSLTDGKSEPADVKTNAAGRAQAHAAAVELAQVKAELAGLPASGPQREQDEHRISVLETKIAALSWVPSVVQGAASAASANDAGIDVDESVAMTPGRLHQELQENAPWLARPGIEHKIMHLAHNKELAIYKMRNGAAKFAILLVPITLPFLWLLFFFRRGYGMFDHAVFSFYSLSAMAVLMTLAALLVAVHLEGTATLLVMAAPPVHMYLQLRGTYALGRLAALWRTLALLAYAGLALLAYFVFVVLVSM